MEIECLFGLVNLGAVSNVVISVITPHHLEDISNARAQVKKSGFICSRPDKIYNSYNYSSIIWLER